MPSVCREHACAKRRFLASAPRVIGWSGRLRGGLTYTRRLGRYGASAAGLSPPTSTARASAGDARAHADVGRGERARRRLSVPCPTLPCLSSSTPPAQGTSRAYAEPPSWCVDSDTGACGHRCMLDNGCVRLSHRKGMSRPPLRVYRRLSRSDPDSQAGRSLPLAGRDSIHWTHRIIEPILTLLRARPADASATSHPRPTRFSASSRRSRCAHARRSGPTPRIRPRVRTSAAVATLRAWMIAASPDGESPVTPTSTNGRLTHSRDVNQPAPRRARRSGGHMADGTAARSSAAYRASSVGRDSSVATLSRTAHGRCPVRAPKCRRVQRPLEAVLEGGWHIMYSSRTNAMMFSNK
jgi:hypothetical protein